MLGLTEHWMRRVNGEGRQVRWLTRRGVDWMTVCRLLNNEGSTERNRLASVCDMILLTDVVGSMSFDEKTFLRAGGTKKNARFPKELGGGFPCQ